MIRTRRLYPQELEKIARAGSRPLGCSETPRVSNIQPSVTIVLLSLDRLHLTSRCIESIYAHSEYPFELLIHDDGSQPGTLAYLRELCSAHDNVTLIEQTTPLGCAVARNRAFSLVKTDYIASLDNDMVCQPGWLRETMGCAVRHRAAFVAPLRLDPGGKVWAFAPELIYMENNTVLEIARWFHDLPPAQVQSFFGDKDITTNFVAGGAGLFSHRAFLDCAGFDEGYEGGFEDLDFGLKLTERGYTVWATTRAMLTHDDEWMPETEADVRYARERYEMDRLRRAAARFRGRWGVDVLPAKYVSSLEQRLERKLGNRTRL